MTEGAIWEAIRLPRSEKAVNQKQHKSPGGSVERCVIRNDLKSSNSGDSQRRLFQHYLPYAETYERE